MARASAKAFNAQDAPAVLVVRVIPRIAVPAEAKVD
jgi:hypothetical protein